MNATAICLTPEQREELRQKYVAKRDFSLVPSFVSAPSRTSKVTGERYPSRSNVELAPIVLPVEERRAAIIAAYEGGMRVVDIALKYGGTTAGVGSLARKHGARRDYSMPRGLKKDTIIAWLLAFPECDDDTIAAQAHCDRSYCGQVRKQLGIPQTQTSLNIERRAKMVELHEQGLSAREVGRKLGVTKNTVNGVLRRVRLKSNTDGGL